MIDHLTQHDVNHARIFAARRHAGQVYGDGLAYTAHLRDVERVLADFGFCDNFWVCLAWLHDTLEDTATTVTELADLFGVPVAAVVWCVSGVGKNRRERIVNIYDKIRAFPRAAILKTADRIANVEASARSSPTLLAMYQQERDGFAYVVLPHIPAAMADRLAAAYGSTEKCGRPRTT